MSYTRRQCKDVASRQSVFLVKRAKDGVPAQHVNAHGPASGLSSVVRFVALVISRHLMNGSNAPVASDELAAIEGRHRRRNLLGLQE